jgi:hypothetical protein
MSFACHLARQRRHKTLTPPRLCFVLIAVSFVWRPHPEPDSSGSESAEKEPAKISA